MKRILIVALLLASPGFANAPADSSLKAHLQDENVVLRKKLEALSVANKTAQMSVQASEFAMTVMQDANQSVSTIVFVALAILSLPVAIPYGAYRIGLDRAIEKVIEERLDMLADQCTRGTEAVVANQQIAFDPDSAEDQALQDFMSKGVGQFVIDPDRALEEMRNALQSSGWLRWVFNPHRKRAGRLLPWEKEMRQKHAAFFAEYKALPWSKELEEN